MDTKPAFTAPNPDVTPDFSNGPRFLFLFVCCDVAAHPVLDIVVDDEVQLFVHESVVRRQYPGILPGESIVANPAFR